MTEVDTVPAERTIRRYLWIGLILFVLLAEGDDPDTVTFPAEMASRAEEPEIAALMASETRLFELRKTSRLGKKAQLESRIEQLAKEHSGLEVQETAKVQEINIMSRELE